MAEIQRTRLVGHAPAPSTQTGGGCLILFAMPFIAIGVFAILLSLGFLSIEAKTSGDAPTWLLTAFGGVFTMAGLGVAWTGGRDVASAGRPQSQGRASSRILVLDATGSSR